MNIFNTHMKRLLGLYMLITNTGVSPTSNLHTSHISTIIATVVTSSSCMLVACNVGHSEKEAIDNNTALDQRISQEESEINKSQDTTDSCDEKEETKTIYLPYSKTPEIISIQKEDYSTQTDVIEPKQYNNVGVDADIKDNSYNSNESTPQKKQDDGHHEESIDKTAIKSKTISCEETLASTVKKEKHSEHESINSMEGSISKDLFHVESNSDKEYRKYSESSMQTETSIEAGHDPLNLQYTKDVEIQQLKVKINSLEKECKEIVILLAEKEQEIYQLRDSYESQCRIIKSQNTMIGSLSGQLYRNTFHKPPITTKEVLQKIDQDHLAYQEKMQKIITGPNIKIKIYKPPNNI